VLSRLYDATGAVSVAERPVACGDGLDDGLMLGMPRKRGAGIGDQRV
jgi:hypothetical protein